MMDVVLTNRVEEDLIGPLWDMYAASFLPLRPLTAVKQELSEAEFRACLVNPEVMSVVATEEGEPVGLLSSTPNFDLVPWANAEFYEREFGEAYADGRVWCSLTVCVSLGRHGAGAATALGHRVAEFYKERNIVSLVDCCLFNDEVVGLPTTIERIFQEVYGGVDMRRVDSQHFYAYVPQTIDLTEPVIDTTDASRSTPDQSNVGAPEA